MLTITLNPSVDIRYSVDKFDKGKVFRTNDFGYTPGGKGLNVTKVIKALNEKVIATGFLGGMSGIFIKNKLDEMEIENNFLKIEGETRNCIAILSDDGSQTEILEPGPSIRENEVDDFNLLYKKLIDNNDVICASGSLPKGISLDTYKFLIETANRQGKKFLLDTSGEALKKGIEAIPYLIKPNKEELENLIGSKISTENDIIKGVIPIIKKGISIVVVSLGSKGSLVFNGNHMYRVIIPEVNVMNPVGSGDSMLAGFAVSINRNYEFEDMLKLATACGTANAMEKETGKIDIDNINLLTNKIKIEKIRL